MHASPTDIAEVRQDAHREALLQDAQRRHQEVTTAVRQALLPMVEKIASRAADGDALFGPLDLSIVPLMVTLKAEAYLAPLLDCALPSAS